MITEGNKNSRHKIIATSTAQGTAKYQDTNKSELTGIYHVVSVIDTIYEKHNIRSEGSMDACDGLNAIKNSMDVNTKYLRQSNCFELILAIDNKLMKSSLTWSWRHMKIHQYEQGEPLNRWETLNI